MPIRHVRLAINDLAGKSVVVNFRGFPFHEQSCSEPFQFSDILSTQFASNEFRFLAVSIHYLPSLLNYAIANTLKYERRPVRRTSFKSKD